MYVVSIFVTLCRHTVVALGVACDNFRLARLLTCEALPVPYMSTCLHVYMHMHMFYMLHAHAHVHAHVHVHEHVHAHVRLNLALLLGTTANGMTAVGIDGLS